MTRASGRRQKRERAIELVADIAEAQYQALDAVARSRDPVDAALHMERTIQRMTEFKILSKSEILAAPDIEEKVLAIPEWKGAVRLRAFTKAQQQEIRRRATLTRATETQKKGEIDVHFMEMAMLIEGIIEPEFTEADIIPLKQKGAGPLERILKELMSMSGMGEEAIERAESQFPE